MTRQPDKQQSIRVAVGYRLRAPEGERLEPARIKVIVDGVRRDDGQPIHEERVVTVIDSEGEVIVEIPGVRNLQELSQVHGHAEIEQGNQLQNSGMVPEDPKLAKLKTVLLEGEYIKKPGSRQGSYRLTARVVLAAPAPKRVEGTIALSRPAGKMLSYVINKNDTWASATWPDLNLTEGQHVEVVAELIKNGLGTDNATWEVVRDHNMLTYFQLDLEKKAKATPTSAAKYQVYGKLSAQLAFRSASGTWKLTSGAAGSGNLGFDQQMGSEDFFQSDIVALKPNTIVAAQATIEDEEKTHTLTDDVTVTDDEPNRLESVRFQAKPVDPKNPYGPHQLRVTFVAVVPSGKGALVTATGADGGQLQVTGHGTASGVIDLGVTSTATTVVVSIAGGNSETRSWQPKLRPVEEPEPEVVDADVVTGENQSTTPVPPPGSTTTSQQADDDRKEEEEKKGVPASVELVTPSDQIIVGTSGKLLVRVLDESNRPCPDKTITWDFVPDQLGQENHGEFWPLRVRRGRTDEQGQMELEYHCHPQTTQFESGARFHEILNMEYQGQSIGEIDFYVAPPLSVRFSKPLFEDKHETIEYTPSLVKTGGEILLSPVISGKGNQLLGDAKHRVAHAELLVGNAQKPLAENEGRYSIPLGGASGGKKIEFQVHLEYVLDQRIRKLNRAAKTIDASIESKETLDLLGAQVDGAGFGQGQVGQEMRPFLVGLTEHLATRDTANQTQKEKDALTYRLADILFFFEHSLGVHQAFGNALTLNELSYKRARDNAAHLVMELFWFDPFRKGVQAGGIGEGTKQLFRRPKAYYADKLKEQFVGSAIEQMQKQRKTLIEQFQTVRKRVKDLRKNLRTVKSATEQLKTLKDELELIVSDLGILRQRKSELQEELARLRSELDDVKSISEDVVTAATDAGQAARQKGKHLLEKIEEQKRKLDINSSKIQQVSKNHERATEAIQQQQRQINQVYFDSKVDSIRDLEGLIKIESLNQAVASGKKAAALLWQRHLKTLAKETPDPTEFMKKIRGVVYADDAAVRRFLSRMELSIDGVAFEGPNDWQRAWGAAFKEQVASMLKSKYGSGEVSELLARREQVLQSVFEEAESKPKPIVLADYEPFDYTNKLRYYGDRAKRWWDEQMQSLGIHVKEVVSAALNETVFDVLAFLFRALVGIATYVIDLFILVARIFRKIPDVAYELYEHLTEAERVQLISELKTKGKCSSYFFHSEARATAASSAFESLKETFDNMLASDIDGEAAKKQYQSHSDAAFEKFAASQRQDADKVIANLAVAALQQPWSSLETSEQVPAVPSWEPFRKLTQEIREYEKDFRDPSEGQAFWATYENAIQQAKKNGVSAANLDQFIDWTAWVVAMLLRFLGLLGLLTTPVTTVGGIAFGAAALGAAELTDVFGALIKTTIAAIFTESNVRGYQTTVMLLQMKTYKELFPSG